MNRRHSGVTDWGLSHVTIGAGDTILDVGCGGGRTVGKLADTARDGKVFGIDFSAESVAAARRANRELIDMGRVAIQQASVADLPYGDDMFDLVTAVETHFWWEDAAAGMREIYRVLQPGGRALIIAEFYAGGKHAKYLGRLSRYTTMAMLTVDEHRSLFADAGFDVVEIVEDRRRGWIRGVGTKPL